MVEFLSEFPALTHLSGTDISVKDAQTLLAGLPRLRVLALPVTMQHFHGWGRDLYVEERADKLAARIGDKRYSVLVVINERYTFSESFWDVAVQDVDNRNEGRPTALQVPLRRPAESGFSVA
jgi:hypothetical protein